MSIFARFVKGASVPTDSQVMSATPAAMPSSTSVVEPRLLPP